MEFMDVDFKELRWRVEALKIRGFHRNRFYGGYVKGLRYEEFRAQVTIFDRHLKGAYRDRDDFLDFVEHMERGTVQNLADYIADAAFEKGGYFDDD